MRPLNFLLIGDITTLFQTSQRKGKCWFYNHYLDLTYYSAMTKEESNKLRKAAEARLGSVSDDISGLSEDDIRKTLQELHTHQIELEIQNDELRLSQFNLEESRQQYSDLYDFAPVGYFTINDKGLIIIANLTASSMLGVERSLLLKRPFSAFIFSEDQDIYYKHRNALIETKGKQLKASEELYRIKLRIYRTLYSLRMKLGDSRLFILTSLTFLDTL